MIMPKLLKREEKTDIKSNGRTMRLLKNKSNLIYNDNMDIYILDTITDKSTKEKLLKGTNSYDKKNNRSFKRYKYRRCRQGFIESSLRV